MDKNVDKLSMLTCLTLTEIIKDKFSKKIYTALKKEKISKELKSASDKIFETISDKYKEDYLAVGYLVKLFYLNIDFNNFKIKTTTLKLSSSKYSKSENIETNILTKNIFKDFMLEFHRYLDIPYDEKSLNLDDHRKLKFGRLKSVLDEELTISDEIKFLRSLSLITKRSGTMRSLSFDNKIVLADNDFIGIFSVSDDTFELDTLINLVNDDFYPISNAVINNKTLYLIVGNRKNDSYYLLSYNTETEIKTINEVISNTMFDKDIDYSGFDLRVVKDKLEMLLISDKKKRIGYTFTIDPAKCSPDKLLPKEVRKLERNFLSDPIFDFDVRFSIIKYVDDVLVKILTDTKANKHKSILYYNKRTFHLNNRIFKNIKLLAKDENYDLFLVLKNPRILDILDLDEIIENNIKRKK